MIIDEQDVFNLIFFPDKVSEEKKKIIQADLSLADVMEFYNQLKLNSERKISDTVKRMIAEKIPAYKYDNAISLNLLVEPKLILPEQNRLAAGTKELTPKTTTKTFVDNEKDYLVKVLNFGDITKIFVFSTKDEIVKNFDIIIEPKSLTFHLEDNSEPLVIKQSIDAEKIQLKFN